MAHVQGADRPGLAAGTRHVVLHRANQRAGCSAHSLLQRERLAPPGLGRGSELPEGQRGPARPPCEAPGRTHGSGRPWSSLSMTLTSQAPKMRPWCGPGPGGSRPLVREPWHQPSGQAGCCDAHTHTVHEHRHTHATQLHAHAHSALTHTYT